MWVFHPPPTWSARTYTTYASRKKELAGFGKSSEVFILSIHRYLHPQDFSLMFLVDTFIVSFFTSKCFFNTKFSQATTSYSEKMVESVQYVRKCSSFFVLVPTWVFMNHRAQQPETNEILSAHFYNHFTKDSVKFHTYFWLIGVLLQILWANNEDLVMWPDGSDW